MAYCLVPEAAEPPQGSTSSCSTQTSRVRSQALMQRGWLPPAAKRSPRRSPPYSKCVGHMLL
eukprot:scaffold138685_cov33-Prasinocladus_malaysianus.AAC.1